MLEHTVTTMMAGGLVMSVKLTLRYFFSLHRLCYNSTELLGVQHSLKPVLGSGFIMLCTLNMHFCGDR